MQKLCAWGLVLGATCGIMLGTFFLLWKLWCFVLGSVYPEGPETIVHPGYWLFVAAWVLAACVGSALFGRGSTE